MKIILFFLSVSVSILIISTCGDETPSDHTENRGGALHKEGVLSPDKNCSACHGVEVKGSATAYSCYSCHGDLWNHYNSTDLQVLEGNKEGE